MADIYSIEPVPPLSVMRIIMEHHLKMPVIDRMRDTDRERQGRMRENDCPQTSRDVTANEHHLQYSALIYSWHQRQLPDGVCLNGDAEEGESDPVFLHCDGSVNQRDNTVLLHLTSNMLWIFISETVPLGQTREWNKLLTQKQRKQDIGIFMKRLFIEFPGYTT